MKIVRLCTCLICMSLSVFVSSCRGFRSSKTLPPIDSVYRIDNASAVDSVDSPSLEFGAVHEVTFADSDLAEVALILNRLGDGFRVVVCENSSRVSRPSVVRPNSSLSAGALIGSTSETSGESSHELAESSPSSSSVRVSGYFSGDINQIVRDVCFSAGLRYVVFDNTFYIGSDFENFRDNMVFETNLTETTARAVCAFFPDVRVEFEAPYLYASGYLLDLIKLADFLKRCDRDYKCYFVSLVLIRMSYENLRDLRCQVGFEGIDLLSYNYQVLDAFTASGSLDLSSNLKNSYLEHSLYCVEGQSASFSVGSDVMRPNRSISDAGTSTVSGYQSFNDGIKFDVTPTRDTGDKVRLKLSFSQSDFTDVSTDISRDETSIEYSSLLVECSRLYYLTSFEEKKESAVNLFAGFSRGDSREILTVWVYVRAVSPVQSSDHFTGSDRRQ